MTTTVMAMGDTKLEVEEEKEEVLSASEHHMDIAEKHDYDNYDKNLVVLVYTFFLQCGYGIQRRITPKVNERLLQPCSWPKTTNKHRRSIAKKTERPCSAAQNALR